MNLANKYLIGVIGAGLVTSATMWEGTKYVPYLDIVKVLTVCQGYTGKDIVVGKKYTPKECEVFLKRELGSASEAVLRCTTVPLTRNQYDAYVLFTYNVGNAAFCNSTSVLKNLNAKNYTKACDGLLDWKYAKGNVVQGLLNRRIYERKMCLGELNV